jgi:hypothetical protein
MIHLRVKLRLKYEYAQRGGPADLGLLRGSGCAHAPDDRQTYSASIHALSDQVRECVLEHSKG